jgi:hypothetical protein
MVLPSITVTAPAVPAKTATSTLEVALFDQRYPTVAATPEGAAPKV